MNNENNNIKPIIKWIGGKTQIIDDIIKLFPKKINNYHELFLGGGSVLFELLQFIKKNEICLNGTINAYDVNETLINMYVNIKNNPNNILDEIEKIINEFNLIDTNIVNRKPNSSDEAKTSKESYYYWIRQQFNKLTQIEKNTCIGTAYFIFLNKTCFRGMYREGPNGFNVPYGNYKKPEIVNRKHLMDVSNLIQNVNFICSDFEHSFESVLIDDFIYLDPPYAPIKNNSFVGYVANGFGTAKHELLFELCKKHNFLMSNSDSDFVKKNFTDKKFSIQTILCKRTINSKKPSDKINEILIKSY